MTKIKLTPVERRILSNQFQILAATCPEESEYHLKMVKVLEQGFEYEYSDLFSGFDESVSEADCIFVREVMGMYLDFKVSDPSDNIVSESEKRFPGFDGNNESGLLSYARFIMSDPHQYRELQRNDYNSHCSLSGNYRKMLGNYDKTKFGQQTVEKIKELLSK